MDYLPLFLNLHNRNCLLVGEGERALPKLDSLAAAGAHITLVSCSPNPRLRQRLLDVGGNLIEGEFSPGQLDHCWLAIAASESEATNRRVAAAAEERRVWLNVVDTPALCSAILPAVMDRSPLLVAISSSGASPMLTTWLRQRLERDFPPAWQTLAQQTARLRSQVNPHLPMGSARRQFWLKLFDALEPADMSNWTDAQWDGWIRQRLAQAETPRKTLLYAIRQPAAPDLLSLRAYRWLSQADVLLLPPGPRPGIAGYARREAQVVEIAASTAITTQLDSLLQPGNHIACLYDDEYSGLLPALRDWSRQHPTVNLQEG